MRSRARPKSLAGIDLVPWAGMHHAYGAASDVPKLLAALTTKKHGAALDELFVSICHQGTIYEPTAHAVPFLLAIACDPTTPNRPAILGLLAAIASGTGSCTVHNPSADGATARERTWTEAVGRSIASGFDSLVELLLHDDEPNACAGAAHVLVRIEGRQSELAEILAIAIQRERDPDARCGMLLAAWLVGPAGLPLVSALRALVDDPLAAPRDQVAAAVALTAILGAAAPDTVIGIVTGEVTDLTRWKDRYSDLPWAWSGERVPIEALQTCPSAIPLLSEALSDADPDRAADILECLVRLAFPSGFQGQLDLQQTQVIRRVVAAKSLWRLPSDAVRSLAHAGLVPRRSSGPQARAALRTLLR